MSEPFTRVEIAFFPEHLNWWLRFGAPDESQDLDRRRSLALFKPDRIFGYMRWRANEHGTQEWRFTIVRTTTRTQLPSRIEGVRPRGDVLLLASGNTKVKCALSQIDALEAAGFEPAEVSPDYYRHVHNRIITSRPVRAYSEIQHQAHLTAQRVSS